MNAGSQIGPGHERWRDSVAAYLVGALPDPERAGLETHLAECPVCRAQADELRLAADVLSESAPVVEPPPALKDRIMAVVESEAELLRAAGAAADRPAPAAPPRSAWREALARLLRPAVVAPVATALVLFGIIVGGALQGSGDRPHVRTVVAEVDRERAPSARVVLEVGERRSRLVVRDLPPPPEGRVYQVWLQRPGSRPEPTPALFGVRHDGTASVDVPGSLVGVAQVMVTHEPRGGSQVPSQAPLIVATPA